MNRLPKTLFIAASTLLISGTALADEPTGDGGGGTESGGEGGGDAGGAAAAAPATGVSAKASGFSETGWSQEIIGRSLTVKKGMIRAQADLGVLQVQIPPIPPATTGETAIGSVLTVGGGYGVSDKLEVGGSYAIALKDFEAKGPLSVYGLYSIKNEEKMRLAAGGALTYNLAAETFSLGLGAAFQYHLNEKMMVFTPGNQLAIGIDPSSAALGLPVGFGFQATPNIFASAQTSLASFGISNSNTTFLFADATPLALSGFYSPSNKMDFGVTISAINLPDFADVFVFMFTARIFAGSVPGGAPPPMAATAVTSL